MILQLNAEELSLDANIPYQISLDCFTPKAIKVNKNEFTWINEELEKSGDNFDLFEEITNIEETQIYEIQRTSGNSLRFDKSSFLQFKLIEEEWKKIYVEFWLKSESEFENLFTMRKSVDQDTIISFSKNDLGFITFPIRENEIIRNDIFLGKDNWNYVGILISNDVSGLRSDVYVNSQVAYSDLSEDNFNLQNIEISFLSKDEEAVFDIDRLKIWKFNNDIGVAEKNKHFLNYEADSSDIIYQTSFDNAEEFRSEYKTKKLEVSSEELNYVQSDAPLFSKAPKLTVNIGSSYNSIVWYVQEYSVAEEFEIERSISGGGFESVYSALADDDPLKIYYFTDELINEHDVAYYRVKQINLDGSEVYSAEVKIGHKEIQEFKLSQNYPNPFNPITSIYVEVIIPTDYKINIYDLVGNTVAVLFDGSLPEGMHTFEFDGSNMPSGIYFYEVLSPKSQSVKKMILAK